MDYHVDSSFPSSKLINIPMDDVKIEEHYSLADLMSGDTCGTTETDSKTDPGSDRKGYTRIYGGSY